VTLSKGLTKDRRIKIFGKDSGNMNLIRKYIFFVVILLMPFPANSQSIDNRKSGEKWVCTWATAQQLDEVVFPKMPLPPNFKMPEQGPPPEPGKLGDNPSIFYVPPDLKDRTVRMVVRTSIGGSKFRVNLSSSLGRPPVKVGSAHVAVYKSNGSIVPETDRVITFNGKPSCTLLPGALLPSDPVDMELPPFTDLAISLYFPEETGAPTEHRLGLHTTWISRGNTAGNEAMPDPEKTYAYLWLAGIDVLTDADDFSIVALGDSITDGFATTLDASKPWPALLAKRLNAASGTSQISVVNQGISGNQVLRDGAGISTLARFDRAVLSIAGVKWVILLEGINDINIRGWNDSPDGLTSDDLIAGYKQIIERSHIHGIRVIGATLTPEEGVPTMSERGEKIRQTINQWIRTSGAFDAVVDFDELIRDPSMPVRMRPEFDPGDHIHPNDAGNQAMADVFDLNFFRN
jgi:lysophospholipase L1-like esterase